MKMWDNEIGFAGFIEQEPQGCRRGRIPRQQKPGKIEGSFRLGIAGILERFPDQLFAASPLAGCKLQQRTFEFPIFHFQECQRIPCNLFQQSRGWSLQACELFAGLGQESPPNPESCPMEDDPGGARGEPACPLLVFQGTGEIAEGLLYSTPCKPCFRGPAGCSQVMVSR